MKKDRAWYRNIEGLTCAILHDLEAEGDISPEDALDERMSVRECFRYEDYAGLQSIHDRYRPKWELQF